MDVPYLVESKFVIFYKENMRRQNDLSWRVKNKSSDVTMANNFMSSGNLKSQASKACMVLRHRLEFEVKIAVRWAAFIMRC